MKKMIKVLISLLLIVTIVACKCDKKKEVTISEEVKKIILPAINDEILESAILYEANIRQYSPEGTFNEFTKDIPQLKKLGVKIIWLMPIFPISEVNRKATGDTFTSEIEDLEERKKYLGSYYSIADYTAVNPDMGTKEDFRNLLKIAHENGMYVLLDWVPNHTGWDHDWITEHPEFYTKNDDGEITDPLNDDGTSIGWTDVADLNYENEKLQEAMINDMLYWITEENIDGFRCDVAGSVPLTFWKKAIPKLRAEKDIFMLAEAWEPELLNAELFEMAYAWEGHHIINEIAKEKKFVKDWDIYMKKMDTMYQKNDILLNFITNHDENSWNGTVSERLGDAGEVMLTLSYILPGMPLIYSGQEYDLSYRLKFFEKDSIPKIKRKIWPILEKLGKLKKEVKALNGGKNAANYNRLTTSNDESILAFQRVKEESNLLFIANMTNKSIEFTTEIVGEFKNALNNEKESLLKGKTNLFEPWEYLILIKE